MSLTFRVEDLARETGVVLVPPGTHRGSVTLTQGLTLRGAPGSELDGEGRHTCLRIDAPGQVVTLERLRFTGGGASAVHLVAGALVVKECTFVHNSARRYGGGAICAAGERLEVRRCRFEQNTGRQGGALLLDEDLHALLCDSLFAFNGAVQGGALRLREGAQVVAVGCTFLGNRAIGEDGGPGHGGSFALSGSTTRRPSLTLENSLVLAHAATTAELWNDATVGGSVQLRSSLLPAPLAALADPSCRVGAVDLSGSLVPPRGSPADGLAAADAWVKVSSVDLAGQPRDAMVGAFASPR